LKNLAQSYFASGYEEVDAEFIFKEQTNIFDETSYKECNTGVSI